MQQSINYFAIEYKTLRYRLQKTSPKLDLRKSNLDLWKYKLDLWKYKLGEVFCT